MKLSVCGVENWPLMVFVLFMKNIEKSSSVRVDEGEGRRTNKRGEGFERCARV